MRCRGTCRSCPAEWKFWWRTVWLVEVVQNFPEECRHVLEMLGEVYRYDAEARDGALTAAERLRFHQEHSGPVMEKLHGWLEAQFAERKTEPNSGLGKAITYLLRHWKALTTFLREAGAPLGVVKQ